MINVVVVYHSTFNQTKQLADAVAEGLRMRASVMLR